MLLAPPPPPIVAGHGMAGVRLGMTRAAVQRRLGSPAQVSGAVLRYPLLAVTLRGGRVAVLTTTSRRLRTPQGFGVGTRVERLQRLPHLVCNLDPGRGDCDAPGIRFDFVNDRVTRVTVMRGGG
jgi:hypothetical protein